jgi:hypothetical protein
MKEEKFILNLGQNEALTLMIRNHFYGGSWDKMLSEMQSGYFKGLVNKKTVQLLKSYEEANTVNLSAVKFRSVSPGRCIHRARHRRVKRCHRKYSRRG